jgi:hypothetical protein
MSREKELRQLGWKKQGIYDEPRLSEVVTMYKEIGFEVNVELTRLEEMSGCTDCMKANPGKYKTVYTRK